MNTCRFITFEGIDGAGKSTQLDAVAERLRTGGATVICTREPGGTPLGERLRHLVLHSPMDALTETLLMFASRCDHIRDLIAPALANGHTVLCDRFTDATFAYQGGGRGMATQSLAQLERLVHGDLQPDLTFWFDLPAATAAKRRAAAHAGDRFEQQDLAFFERVRSAYEARAEADPERFVRIDSSLSREAVSQQIDAALKARAW